MITCVHRVNQPCGDRKRMKRSSLAPKIFNRERLLAMAYAISTIAYGQHGIPHVKLDNCRVQNALHTVYLYLSSWT